MYRWSAGERDKSEEIVEKKIKLVSRSLIMAVKKEKNK